jgi:hypothetical protein
MKKGRGCYTAALLYYTVLAMLHCARRLLLPLRGRGYIGPWPDKLLGGDYDPARGVAHPPICVYLPVALRPPAGSRCPGVSAPGRGTEHPRPKRTPYERQDTLWAVSRGRTGGPPAGGWNPPRRRPPPKEPVTQGKKETLWRARDPMKGFAWSHPMPPAPLVGPEPSGEAKNTAGSRSAPSPRLVSWCARRCV